MKVKDLLKAKGHRTITIDPDKTVKQAMNRIVEHRVGALPVIEKDQLVGIISERDIFRLMREKGDKAFALTVKEVMTTRLIIGILDDDLETVEAVLTNNRFRHLPIMDGPKLVGIISIGDVVKAHVKGLKTENRYLIDYITGKYPG